MPGLNIEIRDSGFRVKHGITEWEAGVIGIIGTSGPVFLFSSSIEVPLDFVFIIEYNCIQI